MVVTQYNDNRVICRAAGNKWYVGDTSAPILLRHYAAFEEMGTAFCNAGKCVMRTLIGLPESQFIYAPMNFDTYDDCSLRGFRELKRKLKKNIKEIKESIRQARKDNSYDLVDIYKVELKKFKKDLNDLKKATKQGLISSSKSRPLDEGDPIKKETNKIRMRKLRAIKAMKKAGLVDEAEDLDRCYDVTSRSVVFYASESDYIWTAERINVPE